MPIKLYSYWRSSSAYRVRIALNLKGLDYETLEVSLADGEQRAESYLNVNPQGLVPFLVDGDIALGQSLAILDYLEERYPAISLLPEAPSERVLARRIANMIACDIQPLCNLRVLKYLEESLGLDEQARSSWYCHWVSVGLEAIEALLEETDAEQFCVGEQPSIADCCLIPQVYNAHRFNVPITAFPRINRINEHCLGLAAFADATPEASSGGSVGVEQR